MTDKAKSVRTTLTARWDERFVTPGRNVFAGRTWFSVTLAAILCVHVALLAIFLWRDKEQAVELAQAEATPVEVIIEPPPNAAPAPVQPPTPAAKPDVEKPATSAPRADNDAKVETEADDKDAHAPKAATPAVAATQPPPEPAKETPAEPRKDVAEAKDDKPDVDPPKAPEVTEKDAEALDKAPPEPPKRPAEFAKAKPSPRVKSAAVQKLAGSSELPDYTFAKPMQKHAKVTGGTEDNRYLAVVYGLISQHHHPIALPTGEWSLAVAFQVDGSGQLVGIGIQQSSGYRDVDLAAIEAVQSAAPFPPPPNGAGVGLVARLRSLHSAALLAGDR